MRRCQSAAIELFPHTTLQRHSMYKIHAISAFLCSICSRDDRVSRVRRSNSASASRLRFLDKAWYCLLFSEKSVLKVSKRALEKRLRHVWVNLKELFNDVLLPIESGDVCFTFRSLCSAMFLRSDNKIRLIDRRRQCVTKANFNAATYYLLPLASAKESYGFFGERH